MTASFEVANGGGATAEPKFEWLWPATVLDSVTTFLLTVLQVQKFMDWLQEAEEESDED